MFEAVLNFKTKIRITVLLESLIMPYARILLCAYVLIRKYDHYTITYVYVDLTVTEWC